MKITNMHVTSKNNRLLLPFKQLECEPPHHKYSGGRPSNISNKNLTLIKSELEKNTSITTRQSKETDASLFQVAVQTIQRNIRSKQTCNKVRARNKPFVSDPAEKA